MNKNEALEQKKANYKFNADGRKETAKERYKQISKEKNLLLQGYMPLIQRLRNCQFAIGMPQTLTQRNGQ